jgi:uncharacterized membrane protein
MKPHGWKPDRIAFWILGIWGAIGFFFIAFGINDARLAGLDVDPATKAFLRGCLAWGDFVFILLATLNIYFAAVRRLGLKNVRRAALIILPGAAILEWIGTTTGCPFGAYVYSNTFGPLIGGVLPAAIPLAWFTVVVGFYLMLSQWLPWLGRDRLALLTGICAMIFDWVMEPYAWKVRFYWSWETGAVPLQNYASWLVAAAFFARVTPLHRPPKAEADACPPLVLGLMLVLFAVGRLGLIAQAL